MLLNVVLLIVIGTVMSPEDIFSELTSNMKERGAPDCEIADFFKPEDLEHYGRHQHALGYGKIQSALDHLRQLDDIDYLPPELYASILLEKAGLEMGQQQYEDGIATIRKVQSLFPEDKTLQLWCDFTIVQEMMVPYSRNLLMGTDVVAETAEFHPELSEIRTVWERIFENDDYDDPMRIYAHVIYSKQLAWCGNVTANPEYINAAIEHVHRAKAIIETVQRENPEWGSGSSPFYTHATVINSEINRNTKEYEGDLLDIGRSKIGDIQLEDEPLRVKPWEIIEREIVQQISAEKVEITYPEMRKVFDTFLKPHLGDVDREAIIDQVTDHEQAAAYLAEIVMNPESDGFARLEAVPFLALTKTTRARETLLELIRNLRNTKDGALTKVENQLLYYAVISLGDTRDERICDPLQEMTDPDYWKGLHVRLSCGKQLPITYNLPMAALYSIADTGSKRAVEIFESRDFNFKDKDQHMPTILDILAKRRKEVLAEEK